MDKSQLKEAVPRIELNSEIKQIYMTGAFGGFTAHDFRLIIFNEKPHMEGNTDVVELVREANHEIMMSFSAAKELSDWLNKRIKEFEDIHGEIKFNKNPAEEVKE